VSGHIRTEEVRRCPPPARKLSNGRTSWRTGGSSTSSMGEAGDLGGPRSRVGEEQQDGEVSSVVEGPPGARLQQRPDVLHRRDGRRGLWQPRRPHVSHRTRRDLALFDQPPEELLERSVSHRRGRRLPAVSSSLRYASTCSRVIAATSVGMPDCRKNSARPSAASMYVLRVLGARFAALICWRQLSVRGRDHLHSQPWQPSA
jgi:hypothetical protein